MDADTKTALKEWRQARRPAEPVAILFRRSKLSEGSVPPKTRTCFMSVVRQCHLWLYVLFGTLLVHPVAAVDYYVSSVGDDSQDGTAPDRAWRTITRCRRQGFGPGDRLLFRAGDAFDGNLVLKTTGAPSAAAPITICSHGQGKALLRAGNGTGISVENCGGIVIRDLIVQGQDRRTNRGSGVSILNTLPAGKCLEHVRIENVEAHRFGKYGIAVGGWPDDKSQSGFHDVRIWGCRAWDNVHAGIHVYGIHDYYAKTYAHHDVAVVNCVAHDNLGDPDFLDNHSGNGILLHNVNGGRIDGCTAFGNGGLCRAQGGGPVGIWAWASRKLEIQNCVSVRNRTGGKYDGGGFDFDGGVSESIMQYNYSAENDGAGYLVFDFGAAPFPLADNVVRFNISENDGRKNGYGGITVNSLGDPVARLHILHNVVFVGASEAKERPSALSIHKSKDCRVHNNLFIASGCALADLGANASSLRIQGNHYWASGSPFLVRHAGAECRSLAAWRRHADVERMDGKDVGSTGDPLLVGHVPAVPPTEVISRTALERFKLRSTSPLGGASLDLKRLFGIDAGDRDFWGNKLLHDHPAAVGVQSGVYGRPRE
jgi:hypothetical protein